MGWVCPPGQGKVELEVGLCEFVAVGLSPKFTDAIGHELGDVRAPDVAKRREEVSIGLVAKARPTTPSDWKRSHTFDGIVGP